ncbi:MAG: multicopper oxidase domain-containing protein [Gemmatimonadaceae bacterium]|nr:multicopper oxidase domain-containing protein [Gemmatimonadaceae bacterium]
MPHPSRLHGRGRRVLSHKCVRATNLVWTDTVRLRVGSTVELLVEVSNRGKWMMPCHITEHLRAGMTGVFTVE